MQSKPFWQSKTVWFNILMTAIGVITLIQTQLQNQPEFMAIWGVYFVLAQGIINLMLRVFYTNTKLTL